MVAVSEMKESQYYLLLPFYLTCAKQLFSSFELATLGSFEKFLKFHAKTLFIESNMNLASDSGSKRFASTKCYVFLGSFFCFEILLDERIRLLAKTKNPSKYNIGINNSPVSRQPRRLEIQF